MSTFCGIEKRIRIKCVYYIYVYRSECVRKARPTAITLTMGSGSGGIIAAKYTILVRCASKGDFRLLRRQHKRIHPITAIRLDSIPIGHMAAPMAIGFIGPLLCFFVCVGYASVLGMRIDTAQRRTQYHLSSEARQALSTFFKCEEYMDPL